MLSLPLVSVSPTTGALFDRKIELHTLSITISRSDWRQPRYYVMLAEMERFYEIGTVSIAWHLRPQIYKNSSILNSRYSNILKHAFAMTLTESSINPTQITTILLNWQQFQKFGTFSGHWRLEGKSILVLVFRASCRWSAIRHKFWCPELRRFNY